MLLFVAFPLPTSAVERLTALRLRLANPGDGLRWTDQEQWHITIRFLGEFEPAAAEGIVASLRTLRAAPVALFLEDLGLFSTKGILFVQVQLTASLQALHQSLSAVAEDAGLPPELWPFRPHISLCRSKNRTGVATLQRLSRPVLPTIGGPLHWQANDLVLYESFLDAQGAVHREVARIPLSI